MQFAIASSVNTLRGTQTLNSLIPPQNSSARQIPPLSSSKNQKDKEKEKEPKNVVKDKDRKAQKKSTLDQDKICESDLIAAAIAEKNNIRNNIYSGISINLDFTKNGQYPLVEFKI